MAASLGLRQAAYFQKETLMTDALVARLKSEFGVDEKIIRLYAQPYVYLNHEMVKQKKIDLAKLQDVIAEEVTKVSGVHMR